MSKAAYGTLAKIAKTGGFKVQYVSGVLNRRTTISKARAHKFERITLEALGLEIPAQVWMFGSPDRIKELLAAWSPDKVDSDAA